MTGDGHASSTRLGRVCVCVCLCVRVTVCWGTWGNLVRSWAELGFYCCYGSLKCTTGFKFFLYYVVLRGRACWKVSLSVAVLPSVLGLPCAPAPQGVSLHTFFLPQWWISAAQYLLLDNLVVESRGGFLCPGPAAIVGRPPVPWSWTRGFLSDSPLPCSKRPLMIGTQDSFLSLSQ